MTISSLRIQQIQTYEDMLIANKNVNCADDPNFDAMMLDTRILCGEPVAREEYDKIKCSAKEDTFNEIIESIKNGIPMNKAITQAGFKNIPHYFDTLSVEQMEQIQSAKNHHKLYLTIKKQKQNNGSIN